MNKWQSMVKEFQQLALQEPRDKPSVLSFNGMDLNAKLIGEELEEYLEANDIVGIADAIGDLLYVVLGAACQHGIDIDPIFHEIHRSNMTKFIDGHRRADGKWIKGPSYTPANLKPILERQG